MIMGARRASGTHIGALAALAFAGITYATSQTLLIPVVPGLQRELGTTTVGASMLISVFAVSGASTAIVLGRWGDLVGRRRMLLVTLAFFCAGAAVCAVAPGLAWLLVGRALMGVALAVFPLSYAIVSDLLPRERGTVAIAILGATVGIGSATGQTLGGPLAAASGPSAVFWASLAMGVASIGVVRCIVPHQPPQARGPVDGVGAALLAATIATPMAAVSLSASWGWYDARLAGLLLATVGLGTLLVRHERRHVEPILHLPTLAIPQVALTNVATFLIGFGAFGASVLLTQFFQAPTGTGLGASASQAGLYLVPGTLIMAALSPMAGRLSRRAGARVTLALGAAICAVGLLLVVMVASHGPTWDWYLWPTLVYLGLGCALGAMPTLVLSAVPGARRGQATATNTVFRSAGMCLGVPAAALCLTVSSGADGLPTAPGFTAAFLLGSLSCAAAAAVSLALPRPGARDTPADARKSRP